MGVFKEEAHAFETIACKSKQIYTDACDYGYAYNTKNVPTDIQNCINAVNKFKSLDTKFPNGNPFIIKREEYGTQNTNVHGVTLTIQIAWEVDEGMECGTEYQISFHYNNVATHIDKTCNAFIEVNCKPYRIPYKKR